MIPYLARHYHEIPPKIRAGPTETDQDQRFVLGPAAGGQPHRVGAAHLGHVEEDRTD